MSFIKHYTQVLILLLTLFVGGFVLSRLPGLQSDEVNPDGVNWHYRSQQFIVALKTHQWANTYQHYHPGITLMWLAGSAIELIKQVSPADQAYTIYNFSIFNFSVKYALVVVQLVLSVVAIYLLQKVFAIYGFKRVESLIMAVAGVALFTFEPFFVGNSRLFHMDVLLTLLLFIGLLLTYLAICNVLAFESRIAGNDSEYTCESVGDTYSVDGSIGEGCRPLQVMSPGLFKALGLHDSQWRYLVWIAQCLFAGSFLGLAFLTKSIAIGGFVFAMFMWLLALVCATNKKRIIIGLLVMTGAFVVMVVLLFPAMWVKPVATLQEIFSEGERVGIRKGHDQIIFGETTTNAGLLFYPLVLLLKLSPFTVLGVLFYVVTLVTAGWRVYTLLIQYKSVGGSHILSLRSIWGSISAMLSNHSKTLFKSPSAFLSVFYLGYFIVMLYPSKKLDRYMLPMFPYFCLISVLGYYKVGVWFSQLIKKGNLKVRLVSGISLFSVVGLFLFFIIYPLITLFPYYFTYTSPLFGPAQNANCIIAQKPFGIGIPMLRDFIVKKYGNVTLGFYDTKPMKSIYGNSTVLDIRVYGPGSYDLLVLGINEEMPDKVLDSSIKFHKDSSVYINGLEYWRIYVKEIE